MMIKCALPVLLVCTLLMTGCITDDISNFYQDFTKGRSQEDLSILMPYSGKTQLFSTKDPKSDAEVLVRRGYVPLGVSSFSGVGINVTEKQLYAHAKLVGADLVLTTTEYLGSEQHAVPFLQVNPGQTTTTNTTGNATANVWGTGGSAQGSANYSGTTTSTTMPTYSTTVVPITAHRYSYEVSFWRKRKPPIFGAVFEEMSDTLRQQFQRNTGVVIKSVLDDSPAFLANILKGDVVIRAGDEDVLSVNQASAVIERNAGKKVPVVILRNGQERVVEVQFNTL